MKPEPPPQPRRETPPTLNPALRSPGARRLLPAEAYAEGLLAGDHALLSQAITLAESTRPEHRARARDVLDRCLPHTGASIRVGITGVPGVGKSTLVGALGLRLVGQGHRLAVLAIDPTSTVSRGSILGDKTRMGALATNPNAFIRPSPTSGALGGIARATREAMLLCEAAGFDIVFVETVGVGQSETDVHSMVDVFLLLALAGAGDALQGIKRGIIEMADVIAVTKADGANREAARRAQRQYRNALRLFPAQVWRKEGMEERERERKEERRKGREEDLMPFEWRPPVLTCSALTGDGLDGLWEAIEAYAERARTSGFLEYQRQEQARYWMHQAIEHRLRDAFLSDSRVQAALGAVEADVRAGRMSAAAAAEKLLTLYMEQADT